MRYRADITKQRRTASVLHFCNARATCYVRLVHAKCSRVMLSACALHQLSRTSTSRLQERLTSSRGQIAATGFVSSLSSSNSFPFWDVSARVYSCVSVLLAVKKLNFSSRGSARTPLGPGPDPISNAHVLPRQGSRPPSSAQSSFISQSDFSLWRARGGADTLIRESTVN